jgi:hypothetical protein
MARPPQPRWPSFAARLLRMGLSAPGGGRPGRRPAQAGERWGVAVGSRGSVGARASAAKLKGGVLRFARVKGLLARVRCVGGSRTHALTCVVLSRCALRACAPTRRQTMACPACAQEPTLG